MFVFFVAAVLRSDMAEAEREVQSLWYVFALHELLSIYEIFIAWLTNHSQTSHWLFINIHWTQMQKMAVFNYNHNFVKHCGYRKHLSLVLLSCRPGNVRRDQDGERKVKGLWNSEIRLSGECGEGLQDDEWYQDQWPGGGRPYWSQRLELL